MPTPPRGIFRQNGDGQLLPGGSAVGETVTVRRTTEQRDNQRDKRVAADVRLRAIVTMIAITYGDPVLPTKIVGTAGIWSGLEAVSGRRAPASIGPIQHAEMIFAVFGKCSMSRWQRLSAVGIAWHRLAPTPLARSRVLHVWSTGRRGRALAAVGTRWQRMARVGIRW